MIQRRIKIKWGGGDEEVGLFPEKKKQQQK
jgi:hypothetical protein